MTRRRGEPRPAALASWAVLAASFGLSAATWIALARLAGFDGHLDAFGTRAALAWLMPVAVDGYVVVALVLWMSPVPAAVARFARANTYAAAGIGVAAQSAYHCLTVLSGTGLVWQAVLAAIVGALPPAGAALSVHMRALLIRESRPAVPSPLPPSIAEAPQVTAPTPAEPVPAELLSPEPVPAVDLDQPAKVRKPAPATAPRRAFATTQRAAAAMQSDGMTVAEIAEALGVSERQVRNALKPVPVGAGVAVGADSTSPPAAPTGER